MDKKRPLIIGAVIAVLIVAAYFLLTLFSGQAPTNFIKQYSDEACNQTAFGCAQEKLRNGSFDCTSLCKEVCSPSLLEKCLAGDFS